MVGLEGGDQHLQIMKSVDAEPVDNAGPLFSILHRLETMLCEMFLNRDKRHREKIKSIWGKFENRDAI